MRVDGELCIKLQNLDVYRKEGLLDNVLGCASEAKLTSLKTFAQVHNREIY
jgi:hypothetical protein